MQSLPGDCWTLMRKADSIIWAPNLLPPSPSLPCSQHGLCYLTFSSVSVCVYIRMCSFSAVYILVIKHWSHTFYESEFLYNIAVTTGFVYTVCDAI